MDELRKKREAFEFGSSSKMASELFKDMQDQANDQMQRFREADELSLQNKDLSIDENGLSDIDTEATKLNKENILKSDILKAKTATETLRNNFAGYSQVEQEQEDNLYIQAPELQEMQSQHIEYRERVVKRTLKPDKVVKEKIEKEVTDKDKQLETKAEMRNMVSEAAAKVKDERIKARANVDIDRKKKMDYNTFNQLSDFSSYMTEEDFRGLTTIYGEGVAFEKKYDVTNPESVEQRNKAREDNLYPAMDRLTDVIMNIDTKKLDVSFDKSISENAEELEKMSAAVKSYKDLLAKNPDYMDKRFSEEANGVSFGSQIMKKVEMLSAISNYYRIRKLVIEDDLYASIANEEISMEEEPGDDVKTKNLKKNMRLSFYAGLHLQQVAADADIEPPIFLTKDKDSEILKGRRMSESMEKLNQLDPEMSETEKYKLYLEELRRQDHVITHTEREQLLIAPKEEYNLLSIAPEKQRSTPNCGPNAKSLFTNKDASKNSYIDIIKDANKTSLYERYLEMEKTKANGSWGSAPQFDGGSEDYLSKLAISDNWNRTHMAFSTEYSYRQTDDEVMEMLDLLSIQKDKAAWDEIKKDPEKVAYYESAYKEMAMKLFEQIYACAIRTAQTLGIKAHLLHPIDLIQQLDINFKRLAVSNAILTNVTKGDNLELIKKLFDENNSDGRYLFDIDMFKTAGNAMATLNYKVTGVQSIYTSVSATDEKVSDEFNEYIKELEKTDSPELEKYKKYKGDDIVDWYIARHPEIYSAENLLEKNEKGEYIHRNEIISAYGTTLEGSEESIKKLVESGIIQMPSDEEINAYEQSLKDREFFALRVPNDTKFIDDLEEEKTLKVNNLNREKEKLEKLRNEENPNEEEISKLLKSIKKTEQNIAALDGVKKYMRSAIKNLKNDPYALKLIKSGFKGYEYQYDGKTYMLPSVKVFYPGVDEE